ncbi:MAG: orotate phosphoribosyltransferase [Firmicutes bacterium]|nr:orotate phosphoribosyltransferase [Bacillota bacterium]
MTSPSPIAQGLLDIQAVFLRPGQPFTWASGIKSPIYTDNRLILSYPDFRAQVEEGLAELVKVHFPEAQVLMGTATAGIAHAALVADRLDLPMGYVRSGSKDHGRQNRIEGRLNPGDKVVVIEDLISTGGSLLDVVEALEEAGAQVIGACAIFTYAMDKSVQAFRDHPLEVHTLTTFDDIVDTALKTGHIEEEDRAKLMAFRDHPQDESWIHA